MCRLPVTSVDWTEGYRYVLYLFTKVVYQHYDGEMRKSMNIRSTLKINYTATNIIKIGRHL